MHNDILLYPSQKALFNTVFDLRVCQHRDSKTQSQLTKNMKLKGISWNCLNNYEAFQTFRINSALFQFSLIHSQGKFKTTWILSIWLSTIQDAVKGVHLDYFSQLCPQNKAAA